MAKSCGSNVQRFIACCNLAVSKICFPSPTSSYELYYRHTVVDSYNALEERESLRLLRYALEEPSKMWLNSSRYTASIMYSITYGKDLDKDGSEDLFAIIGREVDESNVCRGH